MPQETALDAIVKGFAALLAPHVAEIVAESAAGLTPAALNQQDAAKYLGISRQSVYNLKRAGTLSPVVVGGSERYLRRDLDRYLTRLANGKRS